MDRHMTHSQRCLPHDLTANTSGVLHCRFVAHWDQQTLRDTDTHTHNLYTHTRSNISLSEFSQLPWRASGTSQNVLSCGDAASQLWTALNLCFQIRNSRSSSEARSGLVSWLPLQTQMRRLAIITSSLSRRFNPKWLTGGSNPRPCDQQGNTELHTLRTRPCLNPLEPVPVLRETECPIGLLSVEPRIESPVL